MTSGGGTARDAHDDAQVPEPADERPLVQAPAHDGQQRPVPAHDPAQDPAQEPAQDGRAARKQLPLWQEVIVLLVLALVLAIVVKAFFLQAFFVPSVSMESTFLKQDRILVEKWSYWNDDVQRGDVLVFADPGGWLAPAQSAQPRNPVQSVLEAFGLYPTGGHLVKRVVGVGGDQVKCCDAKGRITVNGVVLEESVYLKDGVRPSLQRFDVTVPDDKLWVMGDNRSESGDSRLHIGAPGGGFVPVDAVVGKVWAIVWPPGRAEILDRPDTFADPALDQS